jgi:two-component system sensor histidine kinase CpxA
MKSLFAKIFLWFWLAAIALTATSVIIAVVFTGAPLSQHWLSQHAELYSRAVVQQYLLEGQAGLDGYLAKPQPVGDIEVTVLGPDGQVLHGHTPRTKELELLRQAQASGETECRVRFAGQCAVVVPTSRGKFTVLTRLTHPRRALRNLPVGAFFVRGVLMVLCVGVLCWALARYIARPVKVLRAATQKLAAGDLTARAAPQLAPRRDELVDLAHDFDVMAARIESLLRSQRQMLGDISHELRSPLTRLGVALELAESGDTDALHRMRGDLIKLDQLIEQILTLNRLDSGGIEFEPIKLEAVLSEIVRDANYEGRAHNVTVDLQSEPATLDANPALLKSCIENIVRNALRYSPENSRVEVESRTQGGQLVVAVRDCGPGVPVEALPRLFEPFYRVAESRSEKSGGRGLGLSISLRAAAAHGGTVTARNREGGGLEVEVRLPLSPK